MSFSFQLLLRISQFHLNFKTIIDDFFAYTATAHWNHTKFVAYYPTRNAFANIYGDMLSTAFGGVGFSWVKKRIRKLIRKRIRKCNDGLV